MSARGWEQLVSVGIGASHSLQETVVHSHPDLW